SVISGPGSVVFANATAAVTTATFSAAGSYVLQLSASDTQLTRSAQTVVAVAQQVAANQPPRVSAGANLSVALPNATVTLNGSVTDDGLPIAQLTGAWSRISGPGPASFSSPSS